MTAVALLATMLGAAGDADAGGRASTDSGSLFGDALTEAGRLLGGGSDSGAAPLVRSRLGEPAAEASAAPDRTIDPQAAIAAMTHLVAWAAPATPVPSATTLQPTIPQVTTSETTLPGEMIADAEVETTPGTAGVETTPVDSASGAVETDAADAVPVAAASTTQMTPDSETESSATGPAPASESAAAVAGRGELRTLQGAQPGDVRKVAVDPVATLPEPAIGGADPSSSDPVAAALRPEPLPRQSSPAIPSMLGTPMPGVGGSLEQQTVSSDGDQAQRSQPAPPTASIAPVAPSLPTATPVSSPDAAATANRAVAAQVAPVVVSIAQRPMGTHQLTMTVNPDSLGPVTVRAHISASGDVQVELSGATDAGRDALRTILVELRRDLAAVMPHATLNVNHGTSADAPGDRGQQATGDAPTGQSSGDREANRGRPEHRRGDEPAPELSRSIQTTSFAGLGAGLDTFA